MQLYLSFIENDIKKFYNTLSEKAKRLYTAVEALKIGHGGIIYIARIVGCSRKTVARGIKELTELSNDDSRNQRIRKPGGGSKPYYEKYNDINEQFLDILKDYTAGNPSNKDIIWTNLTPKEIVDRIAEKYTLGVSE
ncbi:MAG: ISAzo13 family transposase, partial [Candidatus Hodarchaeota archaeon]